MRFASLALFVLGFVIGFGPPAGSAQTKTPGSAEPRTVVDYYLLLPDKYFEGDRDMRLHWMLDPKRGAIVDLKHGYLYAAGDGAQTDIYVALFKRTNGKYLIAVNYNDKHDVFESFLVFYEYDQGRLGLVTDPVLPVAFDKNLYYELPRQGTTIVVTDKSGKRRYRLVWNKRQSRFRQAAGK
jgi:hypothetical protein